MSDVSNSELRRLDATLLLVLDEALRLRRLSAVAERLGLTPSAVSHAIARLRDIFDDPLFVRRPQGVEPTPRALGLEAPVRAALEALRVALAAEPPFDPATVQRTSNGAPDHETALLAPGLMSAADTPGLAYVFRPLTRGAALRGLQDGEIELALGYLRARADGVVAEVLYEETYAVVMRRGHPAAAEAELDLPAYLAWPHVLVSPAGDLHGVVDAQLRRMGLARRVAGSAPYFLTALAVAAGGDALATVPRRLAAAFAERFDLVTRAPPLPIRSFPVQAAWAARRDGDPGLQWLRARLAALADATAARPPAQRGTDRIGAP